MAELGLRCHPWVPLLLSLCHSHATPRGAAGRTRAHTPASSAPVALSFTGFQRLLPRPHPEVALSYHPRLQQLFLCPQPSMPASLSFQNCTKAVILMDPLLPNPSDPSVSGKGRDLSLSTPATTLPAPGASENPAPALPTKVRPSKLHPTGPTLLTRCPRPGSTWRPPDPLHLQEALVQAQAWRHRAHCRCSHSRKG